MNKYPLDSQAIQEIAKDLVLHDQANLEIIKAMGDLLEEAMDNADDEHAWVKDAEKLFRTLKTRKIDFENHRFNQKNGYGVKDRSPYKESDIEARFTKIDIPEEEKARPLDADPNDEMTAEEIAQHFGEKHFKKKKKKDKKISKMSLKEIEEWEKAQDNSNDIYKVSARVKNHARNNAGANLTATGDMLCNTFTHVLKTLYDFAETIPDKQTKIKLIEILRVNENMPAQFIAATKNGAIR